MLPSNLYKTEHIIFSPQITHPSPFGEPVKFTLDNYTIDRETFDGPVVNWKTALLSPLQVI